MEKLKNTMMNYENSRILDIGTGNGNFIKVLTSLDIKFKSAVGIDVLESSINSCNANFNDDRISFLQMNALHMDFDDDSFDIVSLSNSFHHLEYIGDTLKEMERVLAPGGVLIICEMISNNLNKKQKSHLEMHHFAAEIDRERGSIHYKTFTDKEVLRLLNEQCSLDIKSTWELVTPEANSISEKELEWLFETIDRVQERVEGSDRIEYYRKKADKLKKYIRKYGFESATQIIVVLGK